MIHTTRTAQAIADFGSTACREAYRMNVEGEGANTIAMNLGVADKLTHNGNRLIDAGREIAEGGVRTRDVNVEDQDTGRNYFVQIRSTLDPQHAQAMIRIRIPEHVQYWEATLIATNQWLSSSEL